MEMEEEKKMESNLLYELLSFHQITAVPVTVLDKRFDWHNIIGRVEVMILNSLLVFFPLKTTN